jgi:hypothetical protein
MLQSYDPRTTHTVKYNFEMQLKNMSLEKNILGSNEIGESIGEFFFAILHWPLEPPPNQHSRFGQPGWIGCASWLVHPKANVGSQNFLLPYFPLIIIRAKCVFFQRHVLQEAFQNYISHCEPEYVRSNEKLLPGTSQKYMNFGCFKML